MVLNFVCRPSKKRKDGLSPIELSVIINGERSIITLDRRVNPSKFNSATQKVKGDKELNEYLDVIKQKCYSIEKELIKADSLTLKDFLDVYRNGFKSRSTTIMEVYTLHNELYERDVVCGRVCMDAFKKYKQSKIRVGEYIKSMGKDDIKLTDITPSFCSGYHTYCLTHLKPSTTSKELKMLKRVLQFAVNERYIDVNPFKLKIKEEKVDHQPLTVEDIEKMWNTEIENQRLREVRDCFIFQTYTGLAYCDMASLSPDDIKDGVIYKKRHKTDVESIIPLLPVSKTILERYNYRLPVISNQKYNSHLKALGNLCGIKQNLTSHLARHSYGTMLLNKGVDMKTVSRTMGHSNMKITESTYAVLRKETVVSNILEKMQ